LERLNESKDPILIKKPSLKLDQSFREHSMSKVINIMNMKKDNSIRKKRSQIFTMKSIKNKIFLLKNWFKVKVAEIYI